MRQSIIKAFPTFIMPFEGENSSLLILYVQQRSERLIQLFKLSWFKNDIYLIAVARVDIVTFWPIETAALEMGYYLREELHHCLWAIHGKTDFFLASCTRNNLELQHELQHVLFLYILELIGLVLWLDFYLFAVLRPLVIVRVIFGHIQPVNYNLLRLFYFLHWNLFSMSFYILFLLIWLLLSFIIMLLFCIVT
jgi:hypothetical protein